MHVSSITSALVWYHTEQKEREENVRRIPVHLGSPLRGGWRNCEKMFWRTGKVPGACQVFNPSLIVVMILYHWFKLIDSNCKLGKCRELVRCLADDPSSIIYLFFHQHLMIYLTQTVMVTTKYKLPRSKPEMMRVTPSFANHCQRVRNIKVFSWNIFILSSNPYKITKKDIKHN